MPNHLGYAVLDFETTGFNARGLDRVVEVGLVLLDRDFEVEAVLFVIDMEVDVVLPAVVTSCKVFVI